MDRKWLALGLVAVLSSCRAELLETLALTVQNDHDGSGGEQTVWTKEYFIDTKSRLTRIKTTTKVSQAGDCNRIEEERLSDTYGTGLGGFRYLEGVTCPGSVVAWKDKTSCYRWTPGEGFSQTGPTGVEVSTKGSRVTLMSAGRPGAFLVLARSPGSVMGIQYDPVGESEGLFPTGKILATGTGLWNSDPETRLFNAWILNRDVPGAIWCPFVFQVEPN